MEIDYNKIHVFLEVVRRDGVTSASRALNRTQSAISQALRSLEMQLGVKLIEWEGKRLRLTREGERIYRASDQQMRVIEEQIRAALSGEKSSGTIEIGFLQDHSTNFLDTFIEFQKAFRKEYPAITFHLHFLTSAKIEKELMERKLDIGLIINFMYRDRFEVFEVATEEHLVVSSPIYSKEQGPFDEMNQVVEADLIDIDPKYICLTPWVARHNDQLIDQLHQRSPVFVAPNFIAVYKLILAGQGIGVVPRYLVERDLKAGRLIQILPKVKTLRVGLDCARERGRRPRPCEELFIQALRKHLFNSDR